MVDDVALVLRTRTGAYALGLVVEGDVIVQRGMGGRNRRECTVLVVASDLLLRLWTRIALGTKR